MLYSWFAAHTVHLIRALSYSHFRQIGQHGLIDLKCRSADHLELNAHVVELFQHRCLPYFEQATIHDHEMPFDIAHSAI